MGFLKSLRETYFGKRPKVKKFIKQVLRVSTPDICVPRKMRRDCWHHLPFTHRLRKQIRVV